MTGKWSLEGESVQNYAANERLYAKIEENSNETTIVCLFFFNTNVHFREEWNYDNALPQERAFSIFYAV